VNDTHENDGENFALAVRKRDGTPVFLWTQAHYLWKLRGEGELRLVLGRHAAVRIEAEGHGIQPDPERFERGVVYAPGEYALESTTTSLWPLLRDGKLTGDGRLLDGAWRYRDERVDVPVPRFYDADRPSGPLGTDRGISPFALGEWCEGDLGRLFFDPAAFYPEHAEVEEPWSRTYLDYPFTGTVRSGT
jgi:hypothetical protein